MIVITLNKYTVKVKVIFLFCLLGISCMLKAADKPIIKIETDCTSLIFQVGDNGRLYQRYLGKKLNHESDFVYLPQGTEVYITHGAEDYFEPAIQVLHNDGNPSLLLKYVEHSSSRQNDGSVETVITLKDDKYPVTVKLHYITYAAENIIKTFTEINHQEKKPIVLSKYASSMLHFNRDKYFLTEFSGDWAHEVNIAERELAFGKKTIDTKLGARANMFVSPFFQLSLGAPSEENSGEVLVGTLGWTGNFRFTFEVDNKNELRVISGINPYASEYSLPAKETFRTPDFYFTYSLNGKGEASRNFHDWARKYQIKKGDQTRMTLLNNWEATYFDFDENKLVGLMDEAVKLGVDMFLLDDGWFGNKYPRSGDHQGLGDWKETADKLPNGVGRLVEEAQKKGIKFGIWIEPEMVNPKSELFETHPDWAITLPNRETYYYRNQLVLDLSNPKVQDFVFGVVDKILTENPEVAFFKWDCNSPITNVYSPYLKNKQGQLYIDHVRGIYKVLERVKAKYPNVPMMLCSGGGARCDYEALKYYTEFWCSDNTDPIERLFIQWGFSQIFPAKAMCAHVTSWNKKTSVKFRTDVASMCKLGFDLGLKELNADELAYCQEAVANWTRLKKVILDGDQYRLVSPYDGNHMSIMYALPDKNKAVLYTYDIHPRFGEKLLPVKLQGLDAKKMYKVKEINLMPNSKSGLDANEKTYSGDYLMKVGMNAFTTNQTFSRVIELTAE